MGVIDSLFSRRNRKTDSQLMNEIKLQYGAQLKREDGTRLFIKPKLDIVGNKLYKSLYDKDVDLIYNFQRYDVNEKIKNGDSYIENNYDIYTNINFERIKDLNYKYFLANVFLSSDRLVKIRDVYFGYAGEIRQTNYENEDPDISSYIKFVDKNILDIIHTEAKTGIMSISQVGLYRGNTDSSSFQIDKYEKER